MDGFHYFVALEFRRPKGEDIREAIEQAFKRTGLKAYYADMEVRQKHILERIKEKIRITQFGIYDVTNGNPNVCLELGIAMGLRKTYYIILEKGFDVPADLQGLDRIEYEGYKNLIEEIKRKIVKKEVNRIKEIRESKKQEVYGEIAEKEVIERCWKLYQAEDLKHQFGREVADGDALNKKSWFANLSEQRNHIIYGPYEELPERGDYIAFFKIKIDDNSSYEPILLLEVRGGDSVSNSICGIHFHKPDKYQLFGIKFKCGALEEMEYRVYNQIQWGKIWIDYVAIVKASAIDRQ